MKLYTDVLIVGGGTAGVTAALAAAGRGAKVIVAEAGSTIGGVGTSSGIHAYFMGLHVGLQPDLDKQARGIARVLGSTAAGFHPEAKKIALQNRLADNSIRILYNCVAVLVMKEGSRVAGVRFETPEQAIEVTAVITLDCTGNGDVAALAGAEYRSGREWDGVMQCFSMTPRYFREDGKLDFDNFDAGWVDSTCTRDVSRALLEGRRLIWTLPALADNRLISTASLFGAREGRLVLGEYTLTLDDLIMDRRFDDVVMKGYSHYDNHATDMANESEISRIWTGVVGAWIHRLGCDVPYRAFLPRAVDGLLIGCRALSMDHDASSSFRMQPDMHAVGEVTGLAAAICCEAGVQPRDVDVAGLQQELIQRGVLEEGDLARPSAPWVILSGAKRGDGTWTMETIGQPDKLDRLIEALGTEEEGSALWWLLKAGDTALPQLVQAWAAVGPEESDAVDRHRRGIATALALLGDGRGAEELVRSVADRDGDALPGYEARIPPRWIASLLALQGLKNTECAGILIRRLNEVSPTHRLATFAEILYTLHYLIVVADKLSVSLREEAAKQIDILLLNPELGHDWYSGGGDCSRIQREVSIRWNIELNAIYARWALGAIVAEDYEQEGSPHTDEGVRLLDNYAHNRDRYIRNMARKLQERMIEVSPGMLHSRKVGSI